MTALDWRCDSWRVAPAATWPRLTKVRTGERPVVVPPERPAPACRYCGRPCHLVDDERRPTHKLCAEATPTPTATGSPDRDPTRVLETTP